MSTTFQDMRKSIESRFSTNWTTTDISWDNVHYDPKSETAFVRFIIDDGDAYQASIGTSPCHRFPGIIHVMIMVPIGTGTNTARGYADSISDIFRGADFDGIQCRTPKIIRVGDVGEYFQISVLVNYWKDAVLANAS